MTVDSYRSKMDFILVPASKFMISLHISPNACTVMAMISSLFSGLAFGFGYPLIAAILVLVNSFFDAVDGIIARLMGIASKSGDYLDHVVDRYADIFILTGIFAYGINSWECQVPAWAIGVFALTGVLMSSYLGTQAQAVGLKRNYDGILGRADRLVLLIVFGIIEFISSGMLLLGLSALGWLLVIFGVFGHITAIQRFITNWRELNS